MYRAVIMGASLHTGNRGVSALASALVSLIVHSRPDASISMLVGHQHSDHTFVHTHDGLISVEMVNYRLSPRAALAQQLWVIVLMALVYRCVPITTVRRWIAMAIPWIRTAVDAQFVGDIRGGDSFSDIYGVRRFLIGCMPVVAVLWIRGGIHMLPQTYGPFRSPFARWLARYILLSANSIWCRDRDSMEQVRLLTNGVRTASLCPDVAFTLEACLPEPQQIQPPLAGGTGTRLIGINVNGLVYHGGYTRANMFGLRLDYPAFLQRVIEQFLSDQSHRVLLVPHTFGDSVVNSDPRAATDLLQRLPASIRSRVHVVAAEYDQHELKGLIGMCDFFIGTRMHACIAALSQGIPTVGVAYSGKFSGVFETIGVADWVIDGRSLDAGQALGTIEKLFNDRYAHRQRLQASVAAARATLCSVFEKMLNTDALANGQGPFFSRLLPGCDET